MQSSVDKQAQRNDAIISKVDIYLMTICSMWEIENDKLINTCSLANSAEACINTVKFETKHVQLCMVFWGRMYNIFD